MSQRQAKSSISTFRFRIRIKTSGYNDRISTRGHLLRILTYQFAHVDDSHSQSCCTSHASAMLLEHDFVRAGSQVQGAIVGQGLQRRPIVDYNFVVHEQTIRASDLASCLDKDVVRTWRLRSEVTCPA